LQTNKDGTIWVDPDTNETSMKGLFSGGDVVTGPGWVIDAIAAGKKGADSIYRYLT
jgi:NADPH-dependent glutamate synthase beta subunit-like oxidoreductase